MIDVSIDTSGLVEDIEALAERQFPYAAAQSLNQTALQFQKAQIEHQRQIFTVRRSSWLDRSVKITKFAQKTELVASIGIHPPGDDQRADILTKFEDQTVKLPFRGSAVAVPTIFIKRNKSDIIPKNLLPSALHLQNVVGPSRKGSATGRVIGDQRTFLIHTAEGRTLILQRYGKGRRSGTAAIWMFVPAVHITPDLDFEANAQAVFETAFLRNFEDALGRALSTSRGAGLQADGAAFG